MSKPRKAAVPAADVQLPQAGGSYIRHADGSLERVTGPAQGEVPAAPESAIEEVTSGPDDIGSADADSEQEG